MNKFMISLMVIGLTSACTNKNIEEDFPNCDTNSMRFSVEIAEVFDSNCFGCHDAQRNPSSGAGIDLSDYSTVKTYVENGRLLGTIEQNDAFSAMPKGAGRISQCSIDKIKSWINEGVQNN